MSKPQPSADEVLVRVRAVAVNHIDYEKASGAKKQVFPLQFPWIPGYDFAGVVEAVGANTKNVAIGDEVYVLHPTHDGLTRIAQQIDEGQLTINMGNVYPLNQASAAWQELMGKPVEGRQKQNGRTVLQID